MPRASDLKNGLVIDINGIPHLVKQIEVKSPSARGAATLYKIRYTNMQSGQKLDETYKGDDMLKDADCEKVPVQYSYHDGDNWVFMNTNDYSQYELSNEVMEDFSPFISEGLEGIIGLLMDGKLLTLILPAAVELEIVETVPEMKGASATSRTKPAKLGTGLEIQVPEYLEQGEVVRVSTSTGKYLSRA
ncbi:MAG TPA: elongation factor P-like protein YeiP [Candidatus Acidoferrum sp.]|nr:elongation factor P-like protein YeiP [Candidatus Acidoferrum sp.]